MWCPFEHGPCGTLPGSQPRKPVLGKRIVPQDLAGGQHYTNLPSPGWQHRRTYQVEDVNYSSQKLKTNGSVFPQEASRSCSCPRKEPWTAGFHLCLTQCFTFGISLNSPASPSSWYQSYLHLDEGRQAQGGGVGGFDSASLTPESVFLTPYTTLPCTSLYVFVELVSEMK